MFVTVEDLQKYGACGQGVKYIERFYPNGAEMIDIIRDRHIHKEFLHWGREHLTTTKEELAAYCEVCKIVNSEGYWYSQNVRDSKYVVRSKDVDFCVSVFYSTDIAQSTDIGHSESVFNSNQVFNSSLVEDCEKIYRGENVNGSRNICNSKMVSDSKNIIGSTNVFGSSEIVECDNITASHFCQNCNNISHCMFCEGLDGAEYYVFNRPVDKARFDLMEQQYKKYLTEELAFVEKWPKEMSADHYIAPTARFDDWYHPISSKFWKWARTLPGYDSMMLYGITMLPELLLGKNKEE